MFECEARVKAALVEFSENVSDKSGYGFGHFVHTKCLRLKGFIFLLLFKNYYSNLRMGCYCCPHSPTSLFSLFLKGEGWGEGDKIIKFKIILTSSGRGYSV